jgi:hypothetical protein
LTPPYHLSCFFETFILYSINIGSKIQELFITEFISRIIFINQQGGKNVRIIFFIGKPNFFGV